MDLHDDLDGDRFIKYITGVLNIIDPGAEALISELVRTRLSAGESMVGKTVAVACIIADTGWLVMTTDAKAFGAGLSLNVVQPVNRTAASMLASARKISLFFIGVNSTDSGKNLYRCRMGVNHFYGNYPT